MVLVLVPAISFIAFICLISSTCGGSSFTVINYAFSNVSPNSNLLAYLTVDELMKSSGFNNFIISRSGPYEELDTASLFSKSSLSYILSGMWSKTLT